MSTRKSAATILAVAITLLAATSSAHAQTAELAQRVETLATDSGELVNASTSRRAIYSEMLHVDNAGWLRLRYAEARLGAAPAGGTPTELRVTSLIDGAVQTMRAEHLRQWRWTSAYFNGDTLLIEVIADPGAAPSRVRVHSAWAGAFVPADIRTICGTTDDRLPSDDPRGARAVPVGCSVWLIDDANTCFLTAGHCTGSSLQIIEFDVPLSTSGGGLVHPGPEDQYAIDPTSVQTNGGQGVGNDWAYFGCFANTETGLTPGEAQGDRYVLADEAPPVTGQDIRITGYGTTGAGVPGEWNQIQKTHVGPYVTSSGNEVGYVTDTTGGNSGSPVVDESTGLAIGIHTHGGCDVSSGENHGTAVQHPGLQDALANPQGVCVPLPPLDISFPDGLPAMIPPTGGSFLVMVNDTEQGAHAAGSGLLHIELGGVFEAVSMVPLDGTTYRAEFPALPCAEVARYYVSAQTTGGEAVSSPFSAPDTTYTTLVVVDVAVGLDDDFETDLGWTVTNEALTAGAWERGVPAGDGLRGDPTSDGDGSGQCYLTGNGAGDTDVDGGPTRLTSPVLDLTGMQHPLLEYWRWFTNDDNDIDRLTIEISNDAGASWTVVESVGASVGWTRVSLPVGDYVAPTDTVQVRFSAVDQPNDSVTEAAVDGVRIVDLLCGTPGDVDGDGDVDVQDLLAVLEAWGPCSGCPADLDGDGTVGVSDLLAVLANWS